MTPVDGVAETRIDGVADTQVDGAAEGDAEVQASGAWFTQAMTWERSVARALQTYGMIPADGGQIALTAASDRDRTAKWEGLLGPRDLAALDVSDFDVVDMGSVFDWTGDCECTPRG